MTGNFLKIVIELNKIYHFYKYMSGLEKFKFKIEKLPEEEPEEKEIDALQLVGNFQKKNRLEQLDKEAKEKGSKVLKLQFEGEQIYSEEFVDELDGILKNDFAIENKEGKKKIALKDIIDKHLKEFSSSEFSHLSSGKKKGQRF